MDKIKYDDIKADLDEESKKYSEESAKEIRWTVSKLQSDQAYFQYKIFLIQNKINELNQEYQKVIGVIKDETIKNV